MGPSALPRLQEISVDPLVLAFAVVASLVSSLVFGSVPAWKHASLLNAPSSAGSRGATAGRERNAARNTLVIVQVALALVLIVSSGLMIRTFEALRSVDAGFTQPHEIQTARISIIGPAGRDAQAFTRTQREIVDRIAAIPGVESATFASAVPMEGRVNNNLVFAEDQTYAAGETPPLRRYKFVAPGYFQTMGTRMIAGRDITWTDIENGGHVALISENFAREVWGEPAAALGERIRESAPNGLWREVVGVVQDIHEDALHQQPPATVYWPTLVENFFGNPAFGIPNIIFVIRSERAGTESLMNEIRQAVWSVNGDLPVFLAFTMQDLNAVSLARTSFTLVLLGIAGVMALGLGVIGIYGVIAYVVSQRTREIGIRLALGAPPRQVQRMVVLHGLTLTAIGVAAGLAGAVVLTRWMSSLLFGVGPLDPGTYLAGLGMLLTAATLASYVPARRAASIDPVETLKAE
jgi:predicted permease